MHPAGRQEESTCALLFCEELEERLRHAGIEVLALLIAEVFQGRVPLPCGPVRSFAVEGIPYVNDSENARGEGDLLAAKSARISSTIPLFVMAVGYIQGRLQIQNGG